MIIITLRCESIPDGLRVATAWDIEQAPEVAKELINFFKPVGEYVIDWWNLNGSVGRICLNAHQEYFDGKQEDYGDRPDYRAMASALLKQSRDKAQGDALP